LPFFYGWIVVAVEFVTMAIGANTRTAFSLLFPPLLAEFGWERGVTAAAFSIGFIAATLYAPFIGLVMDRFGPRYVVSFGVLLVSTGIATATLIQQPWHLHLTLGVLVVGGSVLMTYVGHSIFLPNWFVRKRGLAIGIAFSGVGVGSILLFPWLQRIIDHVGWRQACWVMAILLCVVLIPLNVLFQRQRPQDMGLAPDGDALPRTTGTGETLPGNVVDPGWGTLPKQCPDLTSLRYDPVVPFWQNRFKDNRHVLFEGVAHLATRFVQLIDDPNRDGEARLRCRLFHQSDHGLHRIEQDALTGPSHMAKKATFDRIELRTIGRIMRHPDGNSQLVDETLEVFLEQVLATTVTATAVAQQQDRRGLWVKALTIALPKQTETITGKLGRVATAPQMKPPMIEAQVVDAVRNDDALGQRGKVVIKRFECLLRVHLAVAIERTQEFLFLRIHAQDGVARPLKVLDEMGQLTELRVPVGCLPTWQHLGNLTPGKAEGIENASHNAGSDREVLLVQSVGNLLGCQIRPHKVMTHGVTSRSIVEGALHLLDQVGLLSFGFLAASARLAHSRTRGIIRQLLELSHAVSDGLWITPQDAGDVFDAAVAQFDGFQGGKPSAVFFR
jgi:hypothetical protein